MKVIGKYFLIIVLSLVVFLLGFNHKDNKQPNVLYKVYLDSELIGTIESREKLEEYVNNQATIIRENIKEYNKIIAAVDVFNKYKTDNIKGYSEKEIVDYLITNKEKLNISESDLLDLNYYKEHSLYKITSENIKEMQKYIEDNDIYMQTEDIYTPNGIEIKKVYTYDGNVSTIEEIYEQIIERKSCTVEGYMFTIKSTEEGIEDIVVYTLNPEIFSDAIEDLITIFVDEKEYENYKNDTQEDIDSTGKIIEKIYIEEEITYKSTNISVDKKIYTNSTALSAYLLYGDTYKEKIVTVKQGDSIESISFDNQISVQEFLIFNDQYTSRDNLLVPNTEVVISTVDPKIQVVTEYYEVVDKETEFDIQEEYNSSLNQGNVIIRQEGKKGLERVSQNVKSINGIISYIDPVGKEIIKPSVPKIISIGTKKIPNVGSTASWGWPTEKGYTLSSYYGYRLSVFAEGNFHSGIDIAGTGYGSKVYAANNGTIQIIKNLGNTSYGKYIMINHNNGYYSLYAHMSKFAEGLTVGSVVSRGDVIGYVGSTGWSTGPHLHYEIRTCAAYSCTTNPLRFYR